MKIGIIVYSQTGNTYSVAEKLQNALIKKGHKVNIEKIEASRDPKQPTVINLTKIPDINKYDSVVFATFVEAFCLCPVMIKYLDQIKTLKGKNITGFVTQFFPYPWMGGNHAIKQMKKACASKDNNISISAIVNWKNKKRDKLIDQLIEDFTSYYKEV